ncbi:MAG: STAS domain-containing protein [Holosporaceae bacterium]|jgi:anti-anti-sigma factor|nr:STAS domain-containing protein [Holosporaceae bacterium]
MEVKTSTQDGVTLVVPVGRVDSSTAKAFEDEVMKAANGNTKMAIQFDKVDYISSAGLRVILMAGKKLTAAKGELVLINMPDKIFSVFKVSGFDKIIKICPNFEEYKQSFN